MAGRTRLSCAGTSSARPSRKPRAQAATSCWMIVLAHRPHPPGQLPLVGAVGLEQGGLHPVDVVGVDQPGLPQLVGGAGELREHQRAVVVEPAGDVLLGDQVHAVAVRRDHHDVRGPVERGHLLAWLGGVHVGDRGAADRAEVAVDPADQPVDLVAQDAVLLDPLPRRRRDLDEDGVLDVEVPVLDQLGERAQPGVDALGVVEPVDAEEDLGRAAERLADLLGALGDRLRAGQLLEARRVDRDRERRGADGAAVGEVDEVAVGLVPDPLADQADEVGRAAGELEADQVGAEQPLEDLAPPRQLLEQLVGRERDVQVEADPQVGPQLAQHLRAPAGAGSRAPRPWRPWPRPRRPCSANRWLTVT